MRKLLSKPWFVIAVAVIAIALVARSVLSSSGFSPWSGTAVASAEPATDDANISGGETPEGAPSSIADALRSIGLAENPADPFRVRAPTPVAEEVVVKAAPLPDETETVQVSAIWTQGTSIIALVNNRPCQAGDRLGRMTVEAIELGGVWVSHWKGRNFVPFGAAFTLVSPAALAAKPITPNEK